MWVVFEFCDSDGTNGCIVSWLRIERIDKRSRTLLDVKIDLLRQYGPNLPGDLLTSGPIDGGHIYKLKVRASVMLRPLLCKGPIEKDKEYTFLRGAIERNGKLPEADVRRAETNRTILVSDPRRRREYESGNRPIKT